jgi:hypothetical protein
VCERVRQYLFLHFAYWCALLGFGPCTIAGLLALEDSYIRTPLQIATKRTDPLS